MRKQQKKDFVKELTTEIKEATSMVMVDYSGMGMKIQQDLSAKLRESGAKMTVVKNTLLGIAGKEAGLADEALNDTVLTGQTAIVMTADDPVSPIQVLGKFIKEFEMPQVKAGIVEGKFQTAEGVMKLSKLPSKETLYAQVVGGIAAPAYGLVGTLNANMQKLVFILDQARQKGGE